MDGQTRVKTLPSLVLRTRAVNMDSERNSSRISSTKNKQIRESKPNRQNVPARKRSLNASYTKQTGTLGTANEPIELDGDPPTHSPVGK